MSNWLVFMLIQLLTLRLAVVTRAAVVGGYDAPLYPFFVEIIELTSPNLGAHVCGGSLLTLDTIVTASHCLLKMKIENLRIVDAPFDIEGWTRYATRHTIKSHYIHQKYDRILIQYDIAIIKLDTPLERSTSTDTIPLCPEQMTTDPPEHAIVTGIGKKIFKNRERDIVILPMDMVQAKVLQEAILNRENCSIIDEYGDYTQVYDGLLCYIYFGKAMHCKGDSGGPLFVKENGKAKCLLGIVSYNLSECQPDSKYPGAFTNVPYFRDWIEETLRNATNA